LYGTTLARAAKIAATQILDFLLNYRHSDGRNWPCRRFCCKVFLAGWPILGMTQARKDAIVRYNLYLAFCSIRQCYVAVMADDAKAYRGNVGNYSFIHRIEKPKVEAAIDEACQEYASIFVALANKGNFNG
jgi:hypothetical protein